MRLSLSVATLALAIAPALSHADEGAFLIGVGGGVLVTDPLEVIDTTWTINPRIGYEFVENGIAELDLAISMGDTRGQSVSYLALTPTLNFRGILIDQLPIRDDQGMTVGRRVSPIQPFLSLGAGVIYKNVSDPSALAFPIPNPDVDFVVKAGPGVQFPLGRSLMLRTDYKIVTSFGTERFAGHGDTMVNWEWTAGIDLVLGGGKDTDDDGITDNLDQCISDPEDLDNFQDDDGCPDTDNDQDGISDVQDECPNDAEDMDGFEDDDGCPDLDNDDDGILDADDVCPVDAGMASARGCPDADEDGITDAGDDCPNLAGPLENKGCPDTDADGVLDNVDECPAEAGPVESFGCPDSDADLVPNYRDDCPDEKANAGINPKRSDGCPSRVFVALDGIKITEKVFFDTNRATIQRRSYSLLDDVAATLNAYPGITKIEVQGHTDSQGSDANNQVLSQNRASAVVLYMTEHGVDTSRLVAMGYGEDQPISDNGTSAGRADNRRVEFKILEETQRVEVRRADEVPAGVETVPVEDVEGAETQDELEEVIEEIQELDAP